MLTFHCRLCPAWYEDFAHLVTHWELAHNTPALAEYVPTALYQQIVTK